MVDLHCSGKDIWAAHANKQFVYIDPKHAGPVGNRPNEKAPRDKIWDTSDRSVSVAA
eukprot:CAMPEP_0113862820 /NCGR_PEP_ID=MMETSP0372-20130328/15727_1 /TAXON_ID=340204 /ORGANISM="Lankesteria abbotti" /LENGTH=56 /DNA_ID=CAMNT_0000844421 /DNA_START=1 /DNA_END=167 /DNA_ORIENTATION=+ /assembly_acc=CAM_ASM_000359